MHGMSELLYINVSKQIEQQIQDGRLKENDCLSERKLAEDFGVSRTVIREALKLLNEKGLVDIRYGKGNVVSVPDNSMVMDKFISSIHNSSLKMEDVVEAREILESAMAGYIIDRVNPKDIEELEEIVTQMQSVMEDGEEYARLDANFHYRLMECIKNEVLELVMGALNNLTNRSSLYVKLEERKITHEEHKRILERLKTNDGEGLREAVLAHITCARARMGMKSKPVH